MALAPGTRLGPYEVLAPIGAGGMGEVYRARDTKLDRSVAIKILPESFAHDPERLARFEREAKTLASLNHPNIANIYGFEEAHGIQALVMELVEGPTLADRIAQEPIPLNEALPIAKQIAEALEAAHEQGIIHRDLKPANIKLRRDGTVKVLDFGLAKALGPEGPGSSTLLSNSPTITSPVGITGVGILLGTAAYMAPEQARGRSVDKRADIWAFGCVLYETLTGKRAFEGEDVSDTLAFVLTKEPNWDALPSSTPSSIRKLLRRCFEKDRRRRLRDIGDARIDLEEPIGASPGAAASNVPQATRRSRTWFVAAAAAIVITALTTGILMWFLMRAPASPLRVQRLTIDLPSSAPYESADGGDLAISPDGTRLVYAAAQNGRRVLLLRSLDQLDVKPLPGTEDATNPFFSPDGESVGFFSYVVNSTQNKLKKVALQGGPAVTIADAPIPPGASWREDGTIFFATNTGGGSGWRLMQVSAAGGRPQILLEPDGKKNETRFGWPDLLPGGQALLFSIAIGSQGFEQARVAVLSLADKTYRTVIEQGYHARYVSSGHIVYMLGGNLMAVPFDVSRLETTGAPTPLIERIRGELTTGEVSYGVSRTGFLVYAEGATAVGDIQRTLVWVDRTGREAPLNIPQRPYNTLRLSPDGLRIALEVRDQENDIWVWNTLRPTLTRLTTGPDIDSWPVWTPDGGRIAFASVALDGQSVYWQAVDKTENPERLSKGGNRQWPTSVSADGKYLLVRENQPKTGNDVRIVELAGNRQIGSVVQTQFSESNGEISPGGQWLAYQSDESGRDEIYVRPFPNFDAGRWPVSTDGGTRPVWSRNGHELFYLSGGNPVRVMSVDIKEGATFSAGTPRKLFEGPYYTVNVGRVYDVSPDGKRFLMIKDVTSPRTSSAELSKFIVVLNWTEELKRLLPTK